MKKVESYLDSAGAHFETYVCDACGTNWQREQGANGDRHPWRIIPAPPASDC